MDINKMTKKQLYDANLLLDKACQDLHGVCEDAEDSYNIDKIDLTNEIRTLKGIISLLMNTGECSSKVIKLQAPKPMHIKIEDGYCIVTMMEDTNNEI